MKYIILPIFLMTACAHTVVPTDPKQCCQRLSLHQQEMEKFTRYCKVALFLHRGDTINDTKVKDLSARAVNVCKFVFGVQTEEQLLSVADLNEGYHKVRHYIIKPGDTFWRHSLPCDPAESACEEFQVDQFTVIVLAFGAGMVTHRVLWSFFDWVLDKLEDLDNKY